MILCNGLALAGVLLLGVNPLSSISLFSFPIFLASATALMLVRDKRASLALLAFTVLQYPIVAVISLIGRSQ
jgi:hypothetical protein